MRSVLIVYGTTDGQTGKIARFVTHQIDAAGAAAVLVNAASGADPKPEEFDGVIVAASVHAGGYQRAVRRWVRRHAAQLNAMPTAFLSVCLGVLEHKSNVDQELARIMNAFFDKTGWHPANARNRGRRVEVSRVQPAQTLGAATHRPPDRIARSRHVAGLRVYGLGRAHGVRAAVLHGTCGRLHGNCTTRGRVT